jgi:hypothetical protein
MDQAKPFKVGDRVVHHYGIKGEFIREDVVTKVHKTSNFKIANTDTQFRQTGQESGGSNAWHRGWVEHWTPELGKLIERKDLERKVAWFLKTVVVGLGDMSDEDLGKVSGFIESIDFRGKAE